MCSSRSSKRIRIPAFYASCIREDTHIGRFSYKALAASACTLSYCEKSGERACSDMKYRLDKTMDLLEGYKTRKRDDLDPGKKNIPVAEMARI